MGVKSFSRIIFHRPVNQRLPTLAGGVEVNQFALVLGAEGTGDSEEIDRLDQRGLALGVLPEVDRDTRGHLQLHLG